MSLRPIADHVIVKPLEAEAKTSGGIVLPDTAKQKQTKGEVIAVGKGRTLPNGRLVEPQVKKGDVVIYGQYSGSEVKMGGVEYKVLTENDILAIVEG